MWFLAISIFDFIFYFSCYIYLMDIYTDIAMRSMMLTDEDMGMVVAVVMAVVTVMAVATVVVVVMTTDTTATNMASSMAMVAKVVVTMAMVVELTVGISIWQSANQRRQLLGESLESARARDKPVVGIDDPDIVY